MVNFTCQLACTTGCPESRLRIFLWRWFWLRLAFKSMHSIKKTASLMWAAIVQSFKGLNRTKSGGKRNWLLFFLSHCLSWDLSSHIHLPLNWELHLQLPWFSDWIVTPAFLGLQLRDGSHRSSHPPWLFKLVLHSKSISLYLSIYLSIEIKLITSRIDKYINFCFWGELWLIQVGKNSIM